MSAISHVRKVLPFGVVNWIDRGRAARASNQNRQRFYSQWLRAGDLVFDVGANVGNRVAAFQNLGCRVVAFDPQPECCRRLRRFRKLSQDICIEQCALGEHPGTSQLSRSSKRDVLASLSEEFIQKTSQSGRFTRRSTPEVLEVRVETLGRMIEKHGTPQFIKIDVEGYELQVLRGLDVAVESVSFEFTGEMHAETIECVERCRHLGMNWFNLSFGESMNWSSPHWTDGGDLAERLHALRFDRQLFGDVYAFRTAPVDQNLAGQRRVA